MYRYYGFFVSNDPLYSQKQRTHKVFDSCFFDYIYLLPYTTTEIQIIHMTTQIQPGVPNEVYAMKPTLPHWEPNALWA